MNAMRAVLRLATRRLTVVAMCAAGLAWTGCGSDSDSSSTSNSSGGGSAPAAESPKPKGKIAIIATRPLDSAFGKPAADAGSEIEAQFGNEVKVQGGVEQAAVQRTIEGYASRDYGLVIMHGAEMQQQAQQIAPKYPKVKFVVVNGNAEAKPNLSSVTYRWEQGGFIAGMAGGYATKAGKVGVVTTIKIPPVQGLAYGFEQGVKHANPKAEAVVSYMNVNEPDTGLAAKFTATQASQGVDVVWALTTGADPGVFRAAGQKNMKVIGFGSDETELGPKSIITSALVDYKGSMVTVGKLFNEGTLTPQVYVYGFEENAFDLGPLVNMPPATVDKIKQALEEAKAGKIDIKPFQP
jgi:basic membrane protein A